MLEPPVIIEDKVFRERVTVNSSAHPFAADVQIRGNYFAKGLEIGYQPYDFYGRFLFREPAHYFVIGNFLTGGDSGLCLHINP